MPEATLFEEARPAESQMRLTALAPWFGSKRTLAPVIAEEIGKHSSYWEPFCGSMAVLLGKPPCKMETVNDLHGDLINLARVIQHDTHGAALYRRLRRVMMHESMMADAKEECRKPFDGSAIDPDRAFWFFLRSWIGRNGVAGTEDHHGNFCRRFTSNGGAPAMRLASAVASIPGWRRRIREVCILRMDAFEMIGRVEDKAGAVIYADPPYLKKSAKYVHDFATDDHARLASLLCRFSKTRVVVSYYEHPDLKAMYPGWTCRRTPITKAMCSQGMRGTSGRVEAPEVLLINGPSYAEAIR